MKKATMLFLISILVFCFGCQKTINPDVVVSNFLTHLQNLEFDQTTKYVQDSPNRDNSPYEDELIRSGFAKMNFKINETKFDGKDSATVSVFINAPNISESLDLAMNILYANRMYQTPDPQSLLKAKAYEIINQNQSPIVQTTIVFQLTQEKGQWYIVKDNQFQNFALSIFGY